MQPHDFQPRRFLVASGVILLLIAVVAFVGFERAPITGAYIIGNEYYSNIQNITAASDLQVVSIILGFLPENYRPISTEDCKAAYITDGTNTIANHTVTINEQGGVCNSVNITFENPNFGNNETNETVFSVYFGKSLQRISFQQATPPDSAAITETNNITIVAGLALPGVATLVWNDITEPMTGNGTTWQAEKANLDNGLYTFKVITEKVSSEERTVLINYTAVVPEQNQTDTNQTNGSATMPWIDFTAPTPENNSALSTNNLSITVNSSSTPTIEFNSSGTLYTYAATEIESALWQKNFTNLTNGIYEYRAFNDNLSTETRFVMVNYTADSSSLAQSETAAAVQTASLQAELLVDNTKPSKEVTFKIAVKNTGNTNITSTSGTVDIFKGSDYIQTLDFSGTSALAPEESGQLTASWTAPEFDVFTANAKISWAGQSSEFSKSFTVGEPLIEVVKLSREQKQNTAMLSAELANKWIEQINSVSVKYNIYNESVLLGTVDAGSQDIPAKSAGTFSAEFQAGDIQGLKVEMAAGYGGKEIVQSLEAAKTQSIVAETKPSAEKKSAFSGITGAFSTIRETTGKNKTATSVVAFTLIAAFVLLFAVKLPRDRKKAYISEYKRRAQAWWDYYKQAGGQTSQQP